MAKTQKKTIAPRNQKAVYHSFAKVYAAIMDNDIDTNQGVVAVSALGGMNRAFALELKKAELAGAKEPRRLESTNFEDTDAS